MDKQSEASTFDQDYDRNTKIPVSWCLEDIHSRIIHSEEGRIIAYKKEEYDAIKSKYQSMNEFLRSVSGHIVRSHDAEIGINWEVIDCAIEHVLEGK